MSAEGTYVPPDKIISETPKKEKPKHFRFEGTYKYSNDLLNQIKLCPFNVMEPPKVKEDPEHELEVEKTYLTQIA